MSAQANSGSTAQSSGPSPSGGSTTDQISTPQRRRTGQIGMGIAVAIAVVLFLVGIGGGYALESYLHKSSTTTIDITETGSSLLYPLMHYYWGPNFTAANSNIVLSTASTGSGTGQTDANESLVNIGASDGYYTPAKADGLLNVPVAISAQLVYYNLPGVTAHLNLNGTILGLIYMGKITSWNNAWIQAANPTVTLPSNTIVPLKRADSSGDTFLFSSFCDMSLKNWSYGVSNTALSGTSWTGETGNSGMVAGLNSTAYSIAYVGISYEAAANATSAHLQYAALGDNESLSASGGVVASNYVLPYPASISNDANLGLKHLNFAADQLEVTLILGGSYAGPTTLVAGAGGTNNASGLPAYPIANLEYNIVRIAPVSASGSVVTSAALAATVTFLEWAISYGNYAAGGGESTWLSTVHFQPLTPEVIGYDQQEIAQISP